MSHATGRERELQDHDPATRPHHPDELAQACRNVGESTQAQIHRGRIEGPGIEREVKHVAHLEVRLDEGVLAGRRRGHPDRRAIDAFHAPEWSDSFREQRGQPAFTAARIDDGVTRPQTGFEDDPASPPVVGRQLPREIHGGPGSRSGS